MAVAVPAAGELETATLETHSGIEALAEDWDRLCDRVEAAPWLRPGWIGAWWEAFGRGALEIVAVRRADELVAVAPLRRIRGELRSATNWQSPGFGFPVADGAAAAALAVGVVSGRPRALSLAFVERDDTEIEEVVRAGRQAGYRLLQRTMERSPYMTIEGTWDEFESGVDAKLRRDLRRRERRLREEGSVEFEVLDGGERLDELLEEGFRVEAAAWKGQGGTAITSDPETRRFYREVAHWAAGRGSLCLAFVRLDGRPLAFDLSLEEAGVHYLLKTGYDDAYARFGPAKLLRLHMLERAFERGLRRYEFLGDSDGWKLEWTAAVRERVLLQLFRGGAIGGLEWVAYAYGRPLARRVLRRAS